MSQNHYDAEPISERPPRRAVELLLLAAVAAAVLATHWPVLSANALYMDDQYYISINHLVRNPSWDSTARFFGEVLEPSTVQGYYQPLAMTSLMLDWALGGRTDNLMPFHRTSLALHVANTLLVVVLLRLLFTQSWVAALVGLLYGVHPMTVEPVAWLAQRKTLLATFFTLICLILYVWGTRRRSRALYCASLAAFAPALLSQPSCTPLPVLLLLLDWWPLRRLNKRAVLGKLPFLAACRRFRTHNLLLAATDRRRHAARRTGGRLWRIPLTLCHNIVFYLYKAVWPVKLTPYNAAPQPFDLSHPMVLAGVIGTVLLVILLLVSLRWTRSLLVGWLFFFIAIFPTMGVIGFTRVIASDKYAYMPALGFLLILAWALRRLWTASPAIGRAATVLVVLVLAGLEAHATRQQLAYWQTTESLNLHMIRATPNVATLYHDLGIELAQQGRVDEAIESYEHALRLDPELPKTHSSLGNILRAQGRYGEAMQHFQTAIRLAPSLWAPYNGLGMCLLDMGRVDDAIGYFQQALDRDPHIAECHNNMGAALLRSGDADGAITHCTEAARLKPELPDAYVNLGLAWFQKGDLARSEAQFRLALRLWPDHPVIYVNLGRVLIEQNKCEEGIRMYEAAVRIAPDDTAAQAGLSAARARCAATHKP